MTWLLSDLMLEMTLSFPYTKPHPRSALGLEARPFVLRQPDEEFIIV
jgi:hypothetical protein